MADDRLRALEREARAGDPGAQARLLQERVRVGAIAADRVTLAAFLGDPRARRALADAAPVEPASVTALADGLERWGREALARAAVAAAQAALPALREGTDAPAATTLGAVRRWLDGEDAAPDDLLERVQHLALLTPEQFVAAPEAAEDAAFDEEALAAALVDGNAAVFAGRAARGAVHLACWQSRGASLFSIAHYAREALFDATGAIGEPAVLAAVRTDLVAWALA